MELETGDMKVKRETVMVASHFFFRVQFFGLSGSPGPSQVTRLISFSPFFDRVDAPRFTVPPRMI